jgi:hypothetical protein
MNRSACLTLLLSATVVTAGFAQQVNPATTTGAPPAAAKAKFATPFKGDALVLVIAGESKPVGKEIVTVYKIKNMASAPLAMLKLDEYWYDSGGKLVSTAQERHRQPFQPGEIIEMTARAPLSPGAQRKQAVFSHANGKVSAKGVKKFD